MKKGESNRLVEALKLAAKRYGLTPPQDASPQQLEDYADPGPIDATFLSLNEGHGGNDLLLSPNVMMMEGAENFEGQQSNLDTEFPELLRRVKSLPMVSSSSNKKKDIIGHDSDFGKINVNSEDHTNTNGASTNTMLVHPCDSMDVEGDKILCCAVPSRFYEVSIQ